MYAPRKTLLAVAGVAVVVALGVVALRSTATEVQADNGKYANLRRVGQINYCDCSAQGKLVRVGTTKDACSRGNPVRFRGSKGDVTVNAGESKLIELPAFTRELTWYCGGSRERCANDEPFSHVECTRAGNGAIQWIFYASR